MSPLSSGNARIPWAQAALAWPCLDPRVSKHLHAYAVVLWMIVARVMTILLQSHDRVAAGEEELVKLAHALCAICCALLLCYVGVGRGCSVMQLGL